MGKILNFLKREIDKSYRSVKRYFNGLTVKTSYVVYSNKLDYILNNLVS